WLLETDKVHYSIELYTHDCRDEEMKISEATVKVVEGEDIREILFLPPDDFQGLARVNFEAEKDAFLSFIAEVTFGFGESKTEEVKMNYHF
ncbi:MAG TPA: hypothetical protein DIT26_02090, partial [Mesotoga infera]|nr:hypothetical protein [Mesotoga infera]